ncbi:MAG: molybdopterin-synthase adenylyltransferase MoeB [Cyclobacteriaceae bacterium]|nr:molybdopterin-synthase adenylyltransferase MoeB [Cyclobacteriaceae bacterium]
MSFSEKELFRYSRHFILPEIGTAGQQKLKNSKVLIVGAGGLGSPVLLYLAAAGIGTLGIVDDDVVEESNLQRQVLFDTNDLQQSKAFVAAEKVRALNPHVKVLPLNVRLTSQNALEILAPYDIVIDGTDNFPTRYLVNDACVLLDKVNIYGSIFRFEGQVSVFNAARKEGGRGPNYRDLFPSPPPPGMVPSCAEGGVLGVLPGIIGTMQANEAIKLITGAGEVLDGKLLLVDAMSMETRKVTIRVSGARNNITSLIDYEQFCNRHDPQTPTIREISVSEYKKLRDTGNPHLLVDIRESWEHELVNIGGLNTAPHQLVEVLKNLEDDRKVIVYCRSGKRSANAIREARKSLEIDHIYNLKGGVLAWIAEIDPSLPTY